MKKALRNIISVFLALAISSSSFGLTIGKMVCCMSGKTTYSLGEMEDCCNHKKYDWAKAVIKKQCCDISNSTIKVDNFTASKVSFNQVSFDVLFVPTVAFSFTQIIQNNFLSYLNTDIPPPFIGKSVLFFIRTLLI